MPDFLLTPFKKWFKAPTIETPFSTIKLPPLGVIITIIFASFAVITSGFVFCVVRGMPMMGYTRGRDGKPKASWIDLHGLSNQFLAEGIVAAMMFSLAAASLISAVYILSKPESEELSDIQEALKKFAYTSPLWCMLSYQIFSMKFGSFSVRFTAR